MKTHTNRVHKNTGTPSPKSQAPTVAPAPKPKQYTLSLISFDGSKAITEGEIVISPEQMEMINQNSPTERIEGHECIDYEKILGVGMAAMTAKPMSCEDAMMQSNALTRLLFNQIEYARLADTEFGDPNDNGILTAGLQQLMWTAQKNLTDTVLAKGN